MMRYPYYASYYPPIRHFPSHFSPPSFPELQEPPVEKEEEKKKETPLFEILGISFFYDDVLLICLIFFLYSEGIQDTDLFLALILLLLS